MSDTQENWLCIYQSEAQPLLLLDKWSPPEKMDEHQSLGLSFQSSQSLLDLKNVKFWREIIKEKNCCQKKDSYLFSREGRHSALCSKSNGSYDIKDFGTLSLIFSTSKYFRRKCQPCPSFFLHPNIPDKWKRAQLSLDQMKKKERVKVKS